MQDIENWQDEVIILDGDLELRSVHERYAEAIFTAVERNKVWLNKTMNWPQYVVSVEDSRKNAQGNYILHHRGYAKMFLIFSGDEVVGVFSFNQIEPTNKTGYIGYWLDEGQQGKGIISRAIEAAIAKYSAEGTVRRFVIKCIVTNEASNRVAQRNGFALEGRLREAEYLNGSFHDQNIYARIVD